VGICVRVRGVHVRIDLCRSVIAFRLGLPVWRRLKERDIELVPCLLQ
jgi:hypothetical protein